MKRIFLVGVACAAVLYLGDYLVLRLRGTGGYDSVQVDVVYQIPQKGNKAEYVPQGVQSQACVRSLFPHDGNRPCWYLRRHTTQQVNF